MAGPFEATTKVALESIFEECAQQTKFGWLVPEENKTELIEKLYDFFATSRNLKDAGDRIIQSQMRAEAKPQTRSPQRR